MRRLNSRGTHRRPRGLRAGALGRRRVSAVTPPVVGPVVALQHMQLGAAYPTSATVAVRAAAAADDIRLRTASNPEMTGAVFTDPAPQDATSLIARVALTGLPTGVRRYYQAVINGNPAGAVASYAPVPEKTPAAFTVAFGSCCEPGNTNGVFARISARNPDLLLSLGDTPYIDATTDNPALFRTSYSNFYAEPELAELLGKTAHAYVWDDHDWSNNNGHAGSPSGPAVKAVYREFQPHYPLLDADAIYHSFVRGRIKFIMLDVRAERVGSTFIGAGQMAWLLSEIDAVASDPGLEGMVLATVVPWLSSADTDTWHGAQAQRQQIADKIVERGLSGRTLAIAGDAHMVAYDDGTNNVWGDFPVFQASPWNRANSTKGGPYSAGVHAATNGQYGILNVLDDGTTCTIQCRGYNSVEAVLISADLVLSGVKIPPGPPVNTTAPAITGNFRDGGTANATTGDWSDATSYSYQWEVGGVQVGTNSPSFTFGAIHVGDTVTCTVTATGPNGTSSAVSNTAGPVTEAVVNPIGAVIQSTSNDSNNQAVKTLAITMPQPATAGNLLVVAGCFDKSNEGFTCTGAGDGWIAIENFSDGGGVSMELYYKIATGGESGDITVASTFVPDIRPTFAFAEFEGPFAANPVGAKATDYSVATRTSVTGTITTTAGEALVLGVALNDSQRSAGDPLAPSGAPFTTVVSSSRGVAADGNPALLLEAAVVAPGSVTFSSSFPTGDQMALCVVEMQGA